MLVHQRDHKELLMIIDLLSPLGGGGEAKKIRKISSFIGKLFYIENVVEYITIGKKKYFLFRKLIMRCMIHS